MATFNSLPSDQILRLYTGCIPHFSGSLLGFFSLGWDENIFQFEHESYMNIFPSVCIFNINHHYSKTIYTTDEILCMYTERTLVKIWSKILVKYFKIISYLVLNTSWTVPVKIHENQVLNTMGNTYNLIIFVANVVSWTILIEHSSTFVRKQPMYGYCFWEMKLNCID